MSFETISKLTDARAKTFTFSAADKSKILYPKDDASPLFPDKEPLDLLEEELLELQQDEIRLELHAKTLSEYYRIGRIPRGLRIEKAPAIGRDDPQFCEKWCEILNHCSMNLMLLVVEQSTKELQAVKSSIKDCVKRTEENHSGKDLEEMQKKLEEQVKSFRDDMMKFKLRKFRRDTMDYKDNRVYKWLSYRPGRPRPQRDQRRQTSSTSSLASSSSSVSFFETDRFTRSRTKSRGDDHDPPGGARGASGRRGK